MGPRNTRETELTKQVQDKSITIRELGAAIDRIAVMYADAADCSLCENEPYCIAHDVDTDKCAEVIKAHAMENDK